MLSLNGLGDRKPSELLQHMQNLNADPATLFKALFLAQLPPDVRRILSTSSKTEIADLALIIIIIICISADLEYFVQKKV